MEKTRYVIWFVGGMVYWYALIYNMAINTICDMVCWWYGIWEKHGIRYGMMVWYRGCIIWLNLPSGKVCFSI